jgi:hypothetical protein
MCDPTGLVFCLLFFIRGVNIVHQRAAREWPKYGETLNNAEIFLSGIARDYEELMSSKFSPRGVEFTGLGKKIRLGQALLEKGKRLVDWEKLSLPHHANGHARSIEFAILKYSAAMKIQRKLEDCLQELEAAQLQLQQLNLALKDRKAYLVAQRGRTCACLAQQYLRQGTITHVTRVV